MYKGPPSDFMHKIGHFVTCFVTASKYSHCELVFSDGMCGSSSARDGGVRLKHIDLESGHWDVFPIKYALDESYARAWFESNTSKKYDWFGLLWFILPIKAFNDPKRYFCSEAIGLSLSLRKPHKLHPQKCLDVLVPKL